MVRLKTIRKFKCPIAICGLLAFAIVIGCDIFCDLGLISFSIPQPAVISTSHDHDDHHTGSHHQGSQHNHGHDHDPIANHHDQSSGEEGCCDDFTQRFYSSLTSNSINSLALIHAQSFKVLSSLEFEHAPVVLNAIDLSHTEFQHLPNGPPGINGQVLRVLINSFQI